MAIPRGIQQIMIKYSKDQIRLNLCADLGLAQWKGTPQFKSKSFFINGKWETINSVFLTDTQNREINYANIALKYYEKKHYPKLMSFFKKNKKY